MHGDEAVHAVKFGELLDRGVYRYDPFEFHGPTLYYFTLPSVWLSGARNFAQTREPAYRFVPAVFGVGLVLLLWLVINGLGGAEAAWAGALTAVSPAMVFYSRYYIQETLLVFFTFAVIAAGWRYARGKSLGWALAAGAGVGLMHATKETCVIAWVSMLGGLALGSAWSRWRDGAAWDFRSALSWRHVAAAAAVAVLVSGLFFSSFLSNPKGALDSILAYVNYFRRSGGAGLHDHPWHFYLQMLIFARYGPGPWWSEGLIVLLAAAGLVAALRRNGVPRSSASFARFLVFYTVLMTILYSAIPYKTPWCMLSFLHGMILLAGIGAAAILRRLPGRRLKIAAGALLAAGVAHLAAQAWRANFVYYADTRNPYVYAHPVNDVVRLAQRVEDIARVDPQGRAMLVRVITPDYWPLPWLLRRFSRVGYWPEIPEEPDAPVIITSPDLQPALDKRLRGAYHVEYFGLRPEVLLLAYVRTDLWGAFAQGLPQEADSRKTADQPAKHAENPR